MRPWLRGIIVAVLAAVMWVSVSNAAHADPSPSPGASAAPPGANAVPPGANAVPPTASAVPPTASAVPPTASAVPPSSGEVPASPAPTEAGQAQRQKNAADQKVSALQTKIASEAMRVAALTTAASRAEQDYRAQVAAQARAQTVEALAIVAQETAQRDYETARSSLVQMAIANYQDAGTMASLSTGSLLTSSDPGAVLDAAIGRQLVSDFQADLTGRLIEALSARTAAEQHQRAALRDITVQTAKLEAIRRQAGAALATARTVVASIKRDLRDAKATQSAADATLSIFLGGWSIADPARATALQNKYAAIARTMKDFPAAARASYWNAQVGQSVVNRALQWLGTPYAWAGGSANGPTRGTCVAGAAQNDCHVTGFDCSGLAMFAWAPYLPLSHFAATQYTSAGRFHPTPDQLLPGDLVFWSDGATAAGIHHVAIYVGQGYVIQAPQSGDIVRMTPLGSVSAGYFGATRPLT